MGFNGLRHSDGVLGKKLDMASFMCMEMVAERGYLLALL